MIASFSWPDLANYSTATAPVVGLVLWIGRLLWQKIKHELTPNNGSSLRDAIDRTEKAVSALTETVTMIHGKVDHTIQELEYHKGLHEGQKDRVQ